MTGNGNNFNLFSVIPDSTKEEALNPTSQLIGQAFRGIAHKLLDPLVRYNIVKDEDMRQFTESVKDKTDAVPIENRDDSKLGLTYKAVEDSTYQLNSEVLREMFSNLIASTVDDRKSDGVRPSFSSILKDLAPQEAILFSQIFNKNPLPLVSVRLEKKNTGKGIKITGNLVLMEDLVIDDQSSLDNLERFGLIMVRPETSLVAKTYSDRYEQFQNSEIYKSCQKSIPFETDDLLMDSARLVRGSVMVTSFGQEFGKIVLSDYSLTTS